MSNMRQLRKWWRGDNSDVIRSGGAYIIPCPSIFGGTEFFVDADNGNDDYNGLTPSTAKATLAAAYALMETNKHDICYLSGVSTHTLSAMLSVAKNRVHFIGVDGAERYYGQRAKVSLGVTTAATDIGTIQNTGVGNTFTNIKFMNSNTVAEGIYCFVDGGEYTLLDRCEIYKGTDLDVTGAAELVANGDSSLYRNCTIGSNVNATTGAIIRPNVLMTRGIISGKVARDVTFENCRFWRKSGNAANRFVYGANANDCERQILFDRCIFWNTKLAAATPAQNVAFGAAQTEGYVLLWNCTSVGAATAMSTTTGVYVDSPVPTANTSGISLQAT